MYDMHKQMLHLRCKANRTQHLNLLVRAVMGLGGPCGWAGRGRGVLVVGRGGAGVGGTQGRRLIAQSVTVIVD